jgi:hypothetical protein
MSNSSGRCTGESLRIECHAARAASAARRTVPPRFLMRPVAVFVHHRSFLRLQTSCAVMRAFWLARRAWRRPFLPCAWRPQHRLSSKTPLRAVPGRAALLPEGCSAVSLRIDARRRKRLSALLHARVGLLPITSGQRPRSRSIRAPRIQREPHPCSGASAASKKHAAA